MKKVILSLILVSGLLVSANAMNNENYNGKRGGKNIEDVKSKIIDRINNRIQKLEDSKTCVEAATDRESLKSCRPSKEERNQMKNDRNSRKAERKSFKNN